MTLIKDLIEIPDHVEKGQFVLRLAEGVTRPEETLSEYVVTPELRPATRMPCRFIKSALQTKTSKASYLHGSFGSGKSHFMAVLHLILQGNTAARGIPELASVITKHNDWIAGKKFLLVPYHMIGSHDMESGILGGYVEFIRRVSPRCADPAASTSRKACSAAPRTVRKRWATSRSSARSAERTSADSEFGDVERHWDAERFETAAARTAGLGRTHRSSSARSSASSSAPTTPEVLGPRRGIRLARQGALGHQQARAEPRLRRSDPVPRRA